MPKFKAGDIVEYRPKLTFGLVFEIRAVIDHLYIIRSVEDHKYSMINNVTCDREYVLKPKEVLIRRWYQQKKTGNKRFTLVKTTNTNNVSLVMYDAWDMCGYCSPSWTYEKDWLHDCWNLIENDPEG